MAPPVEHEIKLRMDGADEARRAVAGLGAALVRARHFEDNALFDDDRRSLLRAGCALRVRRAEGRAVLTYKGPRQTREDGVKSRPEVEVEVSDADGLEAVLGALGYRRVFRYQKYRETWRWRDVEIVVDEMPVGVFLEIEGPAETIHEAARALGRTAADYIDESYAGLFTARGGQGDMVFE